MIKKLSTGLLIILIALMISSDVYAFGLLYDGIGFRYINDDGTFATNCRKSVNYFALHFNEAGYADVTGWAACAGKWKSTKKGNRYYFTDGKVPTGNWLLPDGKYYTFDNGYVVTGAGESGGSSNSSKASNSSSGGSTSNSSSGGSKSSGNNSSGNNNTSSGSDSSSSANNNESVANNTDTNNSASNSSNASTATVNIADTDYVYADLNSKIFHKTSKCSAMRGSTSTPMQYSNAKASGCSPCSVCWQ